MFGGEIFLDPKSHVPKFLGENIFGPKHLGTELSQFRNVTGPLCFGTEIFRGRNDPGSKCPGPDFHRLKRVSYPWPNHSGTETSQIKHYLGLKSTGTEMTLEHVSWNQNVSVKKRFGNEISGNRKVKGSKYDGIKMT